MSNHFTIHNDKNIDNVIQKDIDYIIKNILTVCKNEDISAIILAGGFGRGEGGIVIDSKSKIKAFNDYDFVVVLKEGKSIPQIDIDKLRQEWAKAIGIDFVDVSFIKEERLPNLPLKIFNYELKYGSKVVYGDTKILDNIPNYNSAEIPLEEATMLLFNRGAGMLWGGLIITDEESINNKRLQIYIINAINKVFQAFGDAILIYHNAYHYSYQKRLELISQINFSEEEKSVLPIDKIITNYKDSIKFKLQPSFDIYEKINLIQWWLDTADEHNKVFKFFEEKRLGKTFLNWYDYSHIVFPYPKFDSNIYKYLRKIASNIKYNITKFGIPILSISSIFNLLRLPSQRLYTVLPFLLYVFDNSEIELLHNTYYSLPTASPNSILTNIGIYLENLKESAYLLNVKIDNLEESPINVWKKLISEFVVRWHGTSELPT